MCHKMKKVENRWHMVFLGPQLIQTLAYKYILFSQTYELKVLQMLKSSPIKKRQTKDDKSKDIN